jgi:MFS family permease
MTTSAAVPAGAVPHPLRNQNFRLWWVGAVISLFGDQFYLVALPWIVLQITGSGIVLAGLMTTVALPRILLILVGGAVSDRLSPRKVMIATASFRATFVTLVALLIWLRMLHLWELYLLSAAFGFADAFAFPAFQAFLPSLVEQRQLVAANATVQGAFQFASIMGPAPAGEIIRKLGAAWAFFLDGISFIFIIAALWALPDPPPDLSPAKQSTLAAIAEGVRYVVREPALLALVLLEAVLNLCMFGPIMVGLAYLAKQWFSSPATYGIWLSALAAGSLLGAVLSGMYRPRRKGLGWTSLTAGCGICLALIPYFSQSWVSAIDLFAMGTMKGILTVQTTSWSQQHVDRAILGRVSSVRMVSGFGLTPVSLLMTGIIMQWSIHSLFASAGVLSIAVAIIATLYRRVREID